jgi:cysteine synthase
VDAIVAAHGDPSRSAAVAGVARVADRWTAGDGDAAAFSAFCAKHFVANAAERTRLLGRLEETLRQIGGHLYEMRRSLRRWNDLAGDEFPGVDDVIASFDPAPDISDQLYRQKVAFIALLNFERPDLRAMLGLGAEITPVSYFSAVPAATAALITKLRLSGKKPYVIPPGGSNGIGALGYVEAGLEIAQQMLERRLPEPDAIVVPLGSGGTVAGLAVGLAAAGFLVPIHAMRVTPRGFVGRALVLAQIRSAIERLRLSDDRFPRILGVSTDLYQIDDHELGEGYGLPTPQARAAMRLAEVHGLDLDPTYTGKTLAGALRLLREGTTASGKKIQRVLYVHTLSSAPLRPLAEKSPSIPHRLDRLLT